ncbi:MAG: DUF1566 domain-containing protein, partial [Chitinophagaceae bacterium]|nr:DUF1566 domain-containing protein [Oligoflexus sp.]
TPAPANCAADGATGCVAVTNFPAVDKVTNLAAGNLAKIHSTVTVGGVVGTMASCSADGGLGCMSVAGFPAADTTGAAAKVLTGQILAGVSGTATPAPANCAADGATGCVAVTNFPAVDKVTNITGNAAKIRSTVTIAGVTGTLADCSTDGAAGCVVVGPTYAAAITAGAGAKIITGQTVAGVSGSATAAPANCAADGATGCVAVTNFPAVDKVTNLAAGNLAKIHSTVTVGGAVGTMASCSADGGLSCMSVAGFPAANTTGAAAKILTGQTLAGVAGTASITPGNCSTDNQTNCVATTANPAIILANVTAGIVKSGSIIAGVTGAYPNSTYPLTVGDGYVDLDFATFNAKIKSVTNFGWFDRNGTRYSTTGSANITASQIQSGVSIFGTTGTFGANCTGDGQTSCLTTSTYKSADTTSFTTWDLRVGKTVAGVAGSIDFFKGTANLTLFNRTTGTGASASTSVADFYDNIDDYNNGGALPTDIPTGWSSSGTIFLRDSLSDTGVGGGTASNGICDGTEPCVYKDRITNLLWSKADTTYRDWETAITYCASLNYGGYTSGWRLPTERELMHSYIDGIWAQKTPLNLTATVYYWTSTTWTVNATVAYAGGYGIGTMSTNYAKTNNTAVYTECVH